MSVDLSIQCYGTGLALSAYALWPSSVTTTSRSYLTAYVLQECKLSSAISKYVIQMIK